LPQTEAQWPLRNRLRIKHLLLLSVLGEVGNIRRAAIRLHMTQPGASKLLKEAEEAFGCQLFDRSRRGITPNEAGLVAIRRATLLLQALDGAREEIASVADDPIGKVFVGAYPVAVSLFLPMTIVRLRASHPRILVTVEEGTNSVLLPALQRGEVDCVVGRLPEQLPLNLAVRHLYDEPVVVVCGRHHRLVGASSPDLSDLAAEDWILPPLDHPFRMRLEALFSMTGLPPPRVIMESASSLMNAATLQSTKAVAMMPVGTARFLETWQAISILPVSLGAAHPPVVVMQRKGAAPSSALRKFLEAMEATAGQLNAPYLPDISAI
jgi:DNA-binding transcriptional LysR family regulator